MPEFQDLLYTVENSIATITLNRPEKRNAFSPAMVDSWVLALNAAQADPSVRVVILTGAGSAFCSGGDVEQLADKWESVMASKNFLYEGIHRIPRAFVSVDKPIIAAINGHAFGAGLDMALWCDMRVASAEAKFAESYVKIGVAPGDGGAYLLPRLIGVARAAEMLFTGKVIDAAEAERIGLINRAVPKAEVLHEARKLAAEIAGGPPLAIRATKRAMYQSMNWEINQHLDYISAQMAVLYYTQDYDEGVQAFLQKRPAQFQGR